MRIQTFSLEQSTPCQAPYILKARALGLLRLSLAEECRFHRLEIPIKVTDYHRPTV